jgi:hypothetical protein
MMNALAANAGNGEQQAHSSLTNLCQAQCGELSSTLPNQDIHGLYLVGVGQLHGGL